MLNDGLSATTTASTSGSLKPQPNAVTKAYRRISQIYQKLLDTWTPHTLVRWVATLVLGAGYMARVLYLQGWYIITYALGIYHLNLFIAFLSPKIDPALELDDYDEGGGPELPTRSNEEFRPFIRRLPEFKFWYSATKAIVVAMICTCFDAFNIPVFWPILVMYFITLFCITMKRQIKHMIKFRYIPFTHGKPRYRGSSEDGAKIASAKSLILQKTSTPPPPPPPSSSSPPSLIHVPSAVPTKVIQSAEHIAIL